MLSLESAGVICMCSAAVPGVCFSQNGVASRVLPITARREGLILRVRLAARHQEVRGLAPRNKIGVRSGLGTAELAVTSSLSRVWEGATPT